MNDRLMVFNGRASYYLASEIAQCFRMYPGFEQVQLYQPEVLRFSNENLKVKIKHNVRGADVFVVQTAANTWHAGRGVNHERVPEQETAKLSLSENLMELLITIDALAGASAGRITVVCPYFPYVRSDKKDEPRISITARLMGQLFKEAGADRVLALNLHALQIQGFMPMPCDQLDANNLIAEYFKREFDTANLGVLATDAGGVKIATAYAQKLRVPLAVCDKRRWGDDEDPEIRNVIGIEEIKGRKIAIFDDEILTGGTMIRAINVLWERFGLKVSYVACVHPVFSEGALEKILDTGVEKVVTTDTLPAPPLDGRVNIVSTAPLLAEAIRNIHTNQSVSTIFEQHGMLLNPPTANS